MKIQWEGRSKKQEVGGFGRKERCKLIKRSCPESHEFCYVSNGQLLRIGKVL